MGKLVATDDMVVLDDEASRQALLQRVVDLRPGETARGSDRVERDVASKHGGRLDQLASRRGQPLHPTIDQLAHADGRQRHQRLLELERIAPTGRVIVELTKELAQEQRIAARCRLQ